MAYQTQRSLRALHLKTHVLTHDKMTFFLIPWYTPQRIQTNQFIMQSTQSLFPLLFTYFETLCILLLQLHHIPTSYLPTARVNIAHPSRSFP